MKSKDMGIDNRTNKVIGNEKRQGWDIIYALLLIAILSIGAYLRFVGLDWDQDYHLHPDERFLTMVEAAIAPVHNAGEFFDTVNSSLNPHNSGYGFYVYGTLPLFIIRYLAQWFEMTGYSQVYLVGRFASAIMDLLTVLVVYLIALELYRKRGLALIATALSAFAVMQIQLSHFFTVDNFTNFFATFALYMAVKVMRRDIRESTVGEDAAADDFWYRSMTWIKLNWGLLGYYALFGVALGMAMASKISAAPLALLLPAAAGINYYWNIHKQGITSEYQRRHKIFLFFNLILAGLVSFLVFRICQPYAFTGPGFFGLHLNPRWIDNLKDLSAQTSGDVDFPPALQWARRPLWFAWYNMVNWGMGIPFGLAAWGSFFWMAWHIVKNREWIAHSLIWGWTAVYFSWQSLNPTSSMRYQILVYPTLAIIAAWGIYSAYKWAFKFRGKKWCQTLVRAVVVFLSIFILGATAAWAYAFTRIYTRPVTRVAASYWIYQNITGPINLHINDQENSITQVLPFRLGTTVSIQEPLVLAFVSRYDGLLSEITFSHIATTHLSIDTPLLEVIISDDRNMLLTGSGGDDNASFSVGSLMSDFPNSGDGRGNQYTLTLDKPHPIVKGETYYLKFSTNIPADELLFTGPMLIRIVGMDGIVMQALPEPVEALHQGENQTITFSPLQEGILDQVYIPHIVDLEGFNEAKSIEITINDSDHNNQTLSNAVNTGIFDGGSDGRGDGYWFELDPPLTLSKQKTYIFHIVHTIGPGAIAIYGSRQANESTWDDAIPLSVEGYSPFDYFTGVYRTDLNFEMYWDDNEEKRESFISILDQTDYIFITSNRQWGTTVRVPERYPLTTVYYRNLLGCPQNKDVLWCYQVAEPGMFDGTLGFDLVKVFQSEPNLGQWQFNTQFAEEAFSVYDHPKVFIFNKRSDYDPERVWAIFRSVDLSTVIHVTPGKTPPHPANLMLPTYRMVIEQAGGTWSELFKRQVLYNRFPALGVILWYLVISLIGWIVYPFIRIAMGGLSDRGYPLIKLAGLILVAYPVWMLGSYEIPFSRVTISAVIAILFIINLGLYILQKEEIKREWQKPGALKYFFVVEGLALVFFLFFLLVRLGNPDLWHPYKGGEKPMDFSFFNAVLKSTSFPPYDPWFSGGYINYYYFGYVIVGVLVKFLGIIPSIAYNFILPTLFSMVALGAFSVGWNLLSPKARGVENAINHSPRLNSQTINRLYAGISSAIGILVLGNLGTLRMIWHGLQRIVAPSGVIEGANFFTRWLWSFQGFIKVLGGNSLPYPPGDWYWIPSRVIPGEPITEFPIFTFLYADLHAHLIALPITILSLAWIISIVQGQWKWDSGAGNRYWLYYGSSMLLGGLVIGTLRPVNTWDLPTYLALGVITVIYTAVRYSRESENVPKQALSSGSMISDVFQNKKICSWVIGLSSALILISISFILYQPFADWYGAGYNSIDLWKGDHTPFWSYITQWGLFLFVIVSWMAWDTIDWMKKTPLSSLNRLQPYKGSLMVLVILLFALVIGLYIFGVNIVWLCTIVGLWAVLLILRPNQSDEKRMVLFWVGTGLALTLAVELIVLRGDIGRMNTVFKFYFQAWTLLALSAAACLLWLFPFIVKGWLHNLKSIWQVTFTLMVMGAALFPITGGLDKIRDRMAKDAPHTLNGMSYMANSQYADKDVMMDLSQDYQAILWMQDNIKGSPTIVECNTPEYRWGSRFTIYTGLPGVVGWNWHERQQRAVTPPNWVTDRIDAIGEFYRSDEMEYVKTFLRTYNVSYIVVGQLEKAYYPGIGLEKFTKWNGVMWEEVYLDDDTSIYQVIK